MKINLNNKLTQVCRYSEGNLFTWSYGQKLSPRHALLTSGFESQIN